MRAQAAALGVLVLLHAAVAGAAGFSDVTKAAGVRFTHESGADGRWLLPEAMGSGVAFLDADGDGWLDLLFVNGTGWPDSKRPKTATPALFRNRGDGTFEDVTKKAGLDQPLYGMGVTVADYDNDGDTDVYMTAVGPDRLLRNRGDGTFEDVTKQAGIDNPDFGAGAAWFDADNDGHLDLFVANYVKWSAETNIRCTLDGKRTSYCTPEPYAGMAPRLYRAKGDGTFEDVTRRSGLQSTDNKGLGVLTFDADADGDVDLFLANDTRPNRLWENQGNGTFDEVGLISGLAFSADGVARGAMGVDAADYDGSGRMSVVIGNFSGEMVGLYHNEGNGLFIDAAREAGVGHPSLLGVSFATFFFDYDLDGDADIFVANGHINPDIAKVQARVTHAQAPLLYENRGGGRFADVTASMGEALATPRVGRGAAYGDYDRDGDLDVVVSTNGGPAVLFRNDAAKGRSVTLRLRGRKSNRDGLGAKVTVTVGGRTTLEIVRTGSSYLSQSQLARTFGLGDAKRADRVEVRWPSGKTQKLDGVAAGHHVVDEQDGLQPWPGAK